MAKVGPEGGTSRVLAREDRHIIVEGQVAGGHGDDEAGRIPQCEAEMPGGIAVEHSAGTQVVRGDVTKGAEGRLHETHAGGR